MFRFIFIFFWRLEFLMLHTLRFKLNSWEGLKLCNTGRPNLVSNPIFKVSGLPKGTVGIDFRLKDLNVPSFNHGGGWIAFQRSTSGNSFK